jgi:hypothetical protein
VYKLNKRPSCKKLLHLADYSDQEMYIVSCLIFYNSVNISDKQNFSIFIRVVKFNKSVYRQYVLHVVDCYFTAGGMSVAEWLRLLTSNYLSLSTVVQ